MTLIVEDGTGRSDAESYISVADVGAYLALMKSATVQATWSAAALADQERACRTATQYLDVRYGSRLPGTRINATMTLLWPREDAWDLDGYEIEDDEIPQRWLDACAELALRVVEGDELLDDQDEPGSVASESVTVGPITVSTSFLGGKGSTKRYPLVERLVGTIVGAKGTVYPG
jgi:hypothetical protein